MRFNVLKISRPRFWVYLLGPYLIGLAAAGMDAQFSFRLLLLGVFFTYPANFLIYGFNDLFDYETDKHNPKKQAYESLVKPEIRQSLLFRLAAWGVLGIILVSAPDVPRAAQWAMTGFYFFGLGYSVPPIRAKTKPLLDSIFNVLYVMPGLVSYGMLTGAYPPLEIFMAAGLWCMAMHAYSAVPDIKPDKKAGISTIATWLGARNTLLFCGLCYLGAVILSYPWLGVFSILSGAIYILMVGLSLKSLASRDIFGLYRTFPSINLFIGLALFFWIQLT